MEGTFSQFLFKDVPVPPYPTEMFDKIAKFIMLAPRLTSIKTTMIYSQDGTEKQVQGNEGKKNLIKVDWEK